MRRRRDDKDGIRTALRRCFTVSVVWRDKDESTCLLLQYFSDFWESRWR
jgi:hypothetical protein